MIAGTIEPEEMRDLGDYCRDDDDGKCAQTQISDDDPSSA